MSKKHTSVKFILQELANNYEDMERFNKIIDCYSEDVIYFTFPSISTAKHFYELDSFHQQHIIRTALSRVDGKAVLGALEGTESRLFSSYYNVNIKEGDIVAKMTSHYWQSASGHGEMEEYSSFKSNLYLVSKSGNLLYLSESTDSLSDEYDVITNWYKFYQNKIFEPAGGIAKTIDNSFYSNGLPVGTILEIYKDWKENKEYIETKEGWLSYLDDRHEPLIAYDTQQNQLLEVDLTKLCKLINNRKIEDFNENELGNPDYIDRDDIVQLTKTDSLFFINLTEELEGHKDNSITNKLYQAFDTPLRNGEGLEKALTALDQYFIEDEGIVKLNVK